MSVHIRPIDPNSSEELDLVAGRMRATLVEVLDEETGVSMYSLDWLKQRVSWHLDPQQCRGQVFVAEDEKFEIIGHSIVRVETDEEHGEFGLFSTTFVTPEARRSAVASQLLDRGEAWMTEQGLSRFVTYTHPENDKLIRLFTGRGYLLARASPEFVSLTRELSNSGKSPAS